MIVTDKKHSKRILTVLILFAVSSALVYSQNAQMINRNDGTLERLYLQSIREGVIPPTTVQSISKAEAQFYGLTAPEKITEPFWDASLSVQPFVIGWTGMETDKWEDGYVSRLADFPSILRLTLNRPIMETAVSFGSNSFYAGATIDFTTDSLIKYVDDDGVLGFWEPGEYCGWWTFPKEAYISWSKNNLTLAAGRLKTGIGLGEANLFLNGQAFWYDQMQLSWWSEKFRFFYFWGTSSSHLNDEEYAVQSNIDPGNTGDILGWDANDNHDYSTQSLTALKMFTYHRLEFKPFRWLGLGLGEMQMIGGKTPDFANLMPLMIWHNTYSSGTTNVMMLADVWTVPLPGVLVYGEFLMDDSRSPSEDKTSKPNCWGWEAGATTVLPVAPKGWTFTVNVEYSHVDEWTYNRWQPYLTMYQRQILTGGWSGIDIPLGHPQGSDVTQAGIRFTAIGRGERRAELGYTWISKGPLYLGRIEEVDRDGETIYVPVYYDYDDWAGSGELTRVTGTTRKYSHVLNCRVVWPIMKNLTLDSEVDFLIIQNYAHEHGKVRTQTVVKTGVEWKYDKKSTGKDQ